MLATLRQVWLTKGTYVTSNQENLSNTPSATSSLELASGASLSDEQDGQTIDPSGPAVALANLSPSQAKEQGLLTSGTCGHHGIGSFSSASLQWLLENKLRTRSRGSILYRLTWKHKVTPSERVLFQLQAMEQDFIGETGSILRPWQTPRARGDAGGSRWRRQEVKNLADQARVHGILCGLSEEQVSNMSLSSEFCRRIMRIPEEWDDCAPTATPSTPRLRKPGAHPSRRFATDNMVISLLVDTNPRKPDTHGHRSFQILLEQEQPITVARYLELGGRRNDLNWDIDHGWAELIESESDED
jgi:hypothetical protein